MSHIIKATRQVFSSLLFIAIAFQSLAVFGSNLKRIEAYKLQVADSDNLKEVLKKSLSAIEGVTSYRVRVERSGAKEDIMATFEYASPDRVHFTAGKLEAIWIGQSIYSKKDDGQWEKYSQKDENSGRNYFSQSILKKYVELVGEPEGAQFIGRKKMGGVPALVYQQTKYTGPDKNQPFTIRYWLNEETSLPLKYRFYSSAQESIQQSKSSIDYIFYDYNADIKIDPPADYVSVAQSKYDFTNGPLALVAGGSTPGSGSNTDRGTQPNRRPVPLSYPQPIYTEKALHNRVQGIVRVKVLIGADGNVKDVKVVDGLPDGLNEEAIRCMYKSRFKPAMKDGQPVEFWMSIDVEFNLR